MEEFAESADSSSVKEGIIALTSKKRLLLDGKIQEMKMSILKVQVSINRV